MTLRLAKFVLTAGLALYYTLVVLNNLTDYDSNYQFVRHVLTMDATFAGNHLMWRAIRSPTVHTAFFYPSSCGNARPRRCYGWEWCRWYGACAGARQSFMRPRNGRSRG